MIVTSLSLGQKVGYHFTRRICCRETDRKYMLPHGDGKLDLEFEGNRQLISEDDVQRFIQSLEAVLTVS